MTDAVPQILLLQPRIGLQADLLKDLYTPLLTKVKGRFRCNESDFTNATDVFAGGKPSVVLAVDGVLSVKQHGVLVQQLAQYTQDGGTVIFCCLFSNFCRPNDMCRLFTRFGLQWKSGDYHRTTFALNEVFQPIFGNQLYSTLKSSYCVKALHVNHVHYNARVYSPAPTSTTQSHVFPAASVDQSQSPAVFTRCGHGYLGYLGDVNNEEGSQALLMAMLGAISLQMAQRAILLTTAQKWYCTHQTRLTLLQQLQIYQTESSSQ